MNSEPASPAGGVSFPVDPDLDVRIERGLPDGMIANSSGAFFVFGSCFHRRGKLAKLEILVDGRPVETTVHGMPRIDLYAKLNPPSAWGDDDDLGSAADPLKLSYRSGFWATVPVNMPAVGELVPVIRATLADGTHAHCPLEPIVAEEVVTPIESSASLAICMATYEPDPQLFAVQIDSIREQTDHDWVCLISDDCSSAERYAMIQREIGEDPRFILSRAPHRLGFYRNFERALGLVPAGVDLVALSDQDDRWYPDKLVTLRGAIGDGRLVYSDQRLVDPGANELAPSYWTGPRSKNHDNFASLLIANTITGAASMFRRDLLDLALPFPETPGTQYHDHWLGLAALASGRIAYVDRPLYDYVQHSGAALGHEAANKAGNTPAAAKNSIKSLVRTGWGSRAAYFYAYCRLRVLAETLLLRGGVGRLGPGAVRAMKLFVAADRSLLGVAWLEARRLRMRTGRTETLGAERLLSQGLMWRRAIGILGALRSTPTRGVPYDAQIPPDPAVQGSVAAIEGLDHQGTLILGTLVEPLTLEVSPDAPERVNLLIPTIELQHLFGGYITKFNLARKLSEHGVKTRILTVDPTPPLPVDWRARVEGYAGLKGLFEHVEVEFARDRDAPVEISPRDRFIATTWWTAHIARAAVEQTERDRFLYLVQEFEPYTHPMGSWAAYALSTYDLPHVAMFSTELLRDFFAERKLGVFSAGDAEGRAQSVAFQNAITAVSPPTAEELASRERKTLLFYARPEVHGARNMFELGLLGLAAAIQRGTFGPEWDFHGIGSVEGRDRMIGLPAGRRLELLSKRDQGSYADVLVAHDAGLALMSTPHPSLVPLEMASAGMLTVTNSFETKTAEAMRALSANLIAVPPGIDGVVAGLAEAVAGADDYDRRISGAKVEWSRDWEDSFSPEVIDRVVELLDLC